MSIRRLAQILCVLALLHLAGCGGGSEPINEGKDRPVPKKDK